MSKKDTTLPVPLEQGPVVSPDLIDDKPDQPKADLRKYNKAEQQVNKRLDALAMILTIADQAAIDDAMEKMKEAKAVETLLENKRKELVGPYNEQVKRINKYAKDLTEKIAPAIQRVKDLILAYQKDQEAKAKKARTAAREQYLRDLGLTPFIQHINGAQVIRHWTIEDQMVFTHQVEDYGEELWQGLLSRVATALQAKKEQEVANLQKKLEADEFFGDEDAAATTAQKIEQAKTAPVIPAASYAPSASAGTVRGLTKRWTFEVEDLSQVPREYLQLDEKKIREAISAGTRILPGLRIYQDESISLR